MRETGSAAAPAVVFLHGGRASSWAWEPVIDWLPGFRCLAPDLPQFGGSLRQGPFEIDRAAEAVARLIRSRVGAARTHLVGFSLGAQVAVQLMAAEPGLVGRAVLMGAAVNTLPYPQFTRRLVGLTARNALTRWALTRRWSAHRMGIPDERMALYRADMRLVTGARLAQVAAASAGFTIPNELHASEVPVLFITGARELPPAHHWAAVLARRMPNGAKAIAVGVRHDWPLRHPGLAGRTVEAWLTDTVLPPEIVLC